MLIWLVGHLFGGSFDQLFDWMDPLTVSLVSYSGMTTSSSRVTCVLSQWIVYTPLQLQERERERERDQI